MKKNKLYVFALICLVLSFALIVTSAFLKEYILYFLLGAGVFLLAAFALLLINRFLNKYQIEEEEKDKEAIKESLEKYQRNLRVLANVNSGDQSLKEIAEEVNSIIVNDTVLEYSSLHDGHEFLPLLRKHINLTGLERFAYIRIYQIEEKLLEKIVNKYPRCFIGEYDNYFDIVIEVFDKRELESYLKEFMARRTALHAVILYYDEYSLDEILDILSKEEYQKEDLYVFDRNSDKEVFQNVLNKYKDIDLDKDNLIEDFLLEIFPYLPITHMAVLIDDEYLRLVNYKGALQFDEIADTEFKTYLKLNGVKYKNRQVYIVYANENIEVPVTPNLLYKLNKVNGIINSLAIIEIDRLVLKESEDRFNRLEELHDSLSYEVDDEYKIIHASKKLNERFNNKLLGSYCYEVLYDKEEPCSNCPLRNDKELKTYMLNSNLYNRVVENNGQKNHIFLLSEKKEYVGNRDELNNRLLGLLNSDAKGYLLCFKIDSLTQLANKQKKSVEEVVNSVLATLNIYGLTDNLFRKEKDEFVYILEHASFSDAIRLSKSVSKAFLETFKLEESEFDFVPKVILLSYPLEVNTLFSLDSLSRTLYNNVKQKGALYRIDEEPQPIDDHRYYMTIVENSYKSGEIPFSFTRIKDKKEKDKLLVASLNYMDDNQNPIQEDEITLYAKIDNKYITLVDKEVRGLPFDKETRFIVPIGKEALNKKLFESINGFLTSSKVKHDRIIFEAKEKDLKAHKEEVEKAMEMGFLFAVNVVDNYNHNLDLSKYQYIRINGRRLESDKGYKNKISVIITENIEILIEDRYKELINNVRYTF